MSLIPEGGVWNRGGFGGRGEPWEGSVGVGESLGCVGGVLGGGFRGCGGPGRVCCCGSGGGWVTELGTAVVSGPWVSPRQQWVNPGGSLVFREPPGLPGVDVPARSLCWGILRGQKGPLAERAGAQAPQRV